MAVAFISVSAPAAAQSAKDFEEVSGFLAEAVPPSGENSNEHHSVDGESMNFAEGMRTARNQLDRYPTACNRPLFVCIGERRIERFTSITTARKKNSSQTNAKNGHSGGEYFAFERTSDVPSSRLCLKVEFTVPPDDVRATHFRPMAPIFTKMAFAMHNGGPTCRARDPPEEQLTMNSLCWTATSSSLVATNDQISPVRETIIPLTLALSPLPAKATTETDKNTTTTFATSLFGSSLPPLLKATF